MVDPNCGSPARQRVQPAKEFDEFELQDESELTEEDEAVMQCYKKVLAKAPQPPFQN